MGTEMMEGRRMVDRMPSMRSRQLPSALRGFPGRSCNSQIGASGYFLDRATGISQPDQAIGLTRSIDRRPLN